MTPRAVPSPRKAKGPRARHPTLAVAGMLVLLATLLLGVSPLHAAEPEPAQAPPSSGQSEFVAGELLVALHPNRAPDRGGHVALAAAGAGGGAGGQAATLLAAADGQGSPAQFLLRVEPGTERETIARLQADPAVAYAEPNWIVWGAGDEPVPVLPGDSLYRDYQWGLQRIDASRAWSFGTGSPSIQVAVVDTGIDFNHGELRGRILRGKNYVSDDPDAPPQDDAGHGTHVAGIIGAAMDNGTGVTGVAPRVLLDPRKALNSRREGSIADVSLAIREATDAGADIINLSLWTGSPSATLQSAVEYAAGKGVLLVAAAGNRYPEPVGWPAAYPEVLAVAATTRDDRRAFYSNTGPEIDLAAPGGSGSDPIVSAWPAGIFCPSSPATGYCTANGTSMSTAFVSGAAALLWGNRPELSTAEVRALLLDNARDIGEAQEWVGRGRLDLRAAMRGALRSELMTTPDSLVALLPSGGAVLSRTFALENPSGDPITWQGATVGGEGWLRLLPATGAAGAGGTVSHGRPASVSAVISTANLPPGNYQAQIELTTRRTNGSQGLLQLPISLLVRGQVAHTHLPSTALRSAGLTWRAPDGQGRRVQRLNDGSSIGLLLPFTFTVGTVQTQSVRLYDDGFLAFSAGDNVPNLPVVCLPDDTPAGQALYAWWSDLDPGRGGAISTFSAPDGAFVIEFDQVPLKGDAGRVVSLQMALFPAGTVQLSYRTVPGGVRDVMVGMEINHSLLYTEIACHASSTMRGTLPRNGETITIEPNDLR